MNAKLTTFAKKLVISRNDSEKALISSSIKALKSKIRKELGSQVSDIMTFGSYTRNTILPRLYDKQSDVDLLVVFNTDSRELTPATYRKKLHDLLAKSYPKSFSKKDAPAVKLVLHHIMFDIVPAVYEPGSRRYAPSYYIPDGSRDWISTEPNDVNEYLASANQKYGANRVRQVVRLCKHWNASKGYPLHSYLMEKEIVQLNFKGDDTYSGFLYAMEEVAGEFSGVVQALDYIREYENREDKAKQLLWLKKLLPRL